MLNYRQIAAFYTAEEILAQIDIIKDAYNIAMESAKDTLNDTQAQQTVMRQKIKDLSCELGIWIEAYNLITGNSVSNISLTSINYAPSEPRI